MKKEIQYKFKVEKTTFLKNIKIQAIKFTPNIEHVYTYFEIPVKDNNFFVVLRIKVSNGQEKLDMKIRDNKTGVWEKFESTIGSAGQIRLILENAGCKPIFTFHKNRQSWIGDFVRLDLDTTKELGTFLEVKFDLDKKEKAEQLLKELDIDQTKNDRRSVIEIYMEKYKS